MGDVVHQRVAVQVFCKQALAKIYALLLTHAVQTVGLPDGFWCFDDEGRGTLVKLVGMRSKSAVLRLLKGKGKSIKSLVRTQPHKTAGAQFNVGLEGFGVARADTAVQAVTGDH